MMNNHTINFKKYSLNELLDALEGIDDVKYPENALKIYKLILKKMGLNYKTADSELLGYKNDNSIKSWLFTLIPFITFFEMDKENLNNQMKEKINRLNSILEKNNKNI